MVILEYLTIKKNNSGDKEAFINYKNKIEKLDSLDELEEFDPGYCRTVHKSQGDEAKNVIISYVHHLIGLPYG